jgi:hypothetical protein
VGSKKSNVRRWENGFEVTELSMGQPNGKLAKAGKRVKVKYVGRLKSNGKVFDKSTKPFTFRLGAAPIISHIVCVWPMTRLKCFVDETRVQSLYLREQACTMLWAYRIWIHRGACHSSACFLEWCRSCGAFLRMVPTAAVSAPGVSPAAVPLRPLVLVLC